MLRDGYLDRAVKRGRRRYAERCALVCDRLAPYGRIAGRDAGLHVTLQLPDGVDDETVAERARAAGADVVTLSSFRRSTPGPDGLVIGYGAPTDDELMAALDLLIPILQDTAETMNA